MNRGLLPLLGLCCCAFPGVASAQQQEIAQLLLNVEKLAQFKEVLQQMKQGYQILSEGYGAVQDITQGNFSLHESFLEGLLRVSPAVRNYRGVSEILRGQLALLQQSKSAYARMLQSGCFSDKELHYVQQVLSRLAKQSVQLLQQLSSLLTQGILRMSDAERIRAIDELLAQHRDRQEFLHYFVQQAQLLSLQRHAEQRDVQQVKQLYNQAPRP